MALRTLTWAFVVFLVARAGQLSAQTSFLEVTPVNDPLFTTPPEEDFWVSAVAPADIDSDGDLDLAVLGFYVVYNVSAVDRLVLFFNQGPNADGRWTFTPVDVAIGEITAGSSDLAWGDFDSDGDPDLALGSEGTTAIFRNIGGSLVLSPVTVPGTTALPGYNEDSSYNGAFDLRSITWSDFDNDSDLDLLIPSVFNFEEFEYETKLLRNDGPDDVGVWQFADHPSGIEPTVHAQSGWADDDGDGDVDLFLVNVDPFVETGFIRRLTNENGVFSSETLVDVKINIGAAEWGDYDSDGDMDVVVAGNIQESDESFNTVLRVYRNDEGTFVPTTLIDAPNGDWLDLLAVAWADYDSDGDFDLLVTGNFVGESEIEGKSDIFANVDGQFVPLDLQMPAPMDSIGRGGAFTWFDLDLDGDLDYLVAGAYFVPGGNGLVEAQMHLFQNAAPAFSNKLPGAPSQLVATVEDDQVLLEWQAAVDDHTPQGSLTYELQITPSEEAVSPPVGMRLPEPGGIGSVTEWHLEGLPDGFYDWKVQAVDTAFNGGPVGQGSFAVGAVPLLDVHASPSVPNPSVSAAGGTIQYSIEIENPADQQRSADVWAAVLNHNGQEVLSAGPWSVAIPAHGSKQLQARQVVPASLRAGLYEQRVFVGQFPGTVEDTDSFSWRKRR